jgi:hypothetical protein
MPCDPAQIERVVFEVRNEIAKADIEPDQAAQ